MDNRSHNVVHGKGFMGPAGIYILLHGILLHGILLLGLVWLTSCNSEPPAPSKSVQASTAVQTAEGTIVAVGDSLTAGLGVAEDMAYPAQLARKLTADGFNYAVVNAGVSGETSSGARSRIDWVISALKPDIVILETGANDGLRGIEPKLLETNLNQICATLKANHIQVILTGMLMLPNLGPEYTRAFSTIYPRVAQEHQVIFMPFFLKDVAGEPQLNQPDRIHPTEQGYARITDNIYPYVLKAIERHRKATSGIIMPLLPTRFRSSGEQRS
jgi:acyl-CoA thioesterase-1